MIVGAILLCSTPKSNPWAANLRKAIRGSAPDTPFSGLSSVHCMQASRPLNTQAWLWARSHRVAASNTAVNGLSGSQLSILTSASLPFLFLFSRKLWVRLLLGGVQPLEGVGGGPGAQPQLAPSLAGCVEPLQAGEVEAFPRGFIQDFNTLQMPGPFCILHPQVFFFFLLFCEILPQVKKVMVG